MGIMGFTGWNDYVRSMSFEPKNLTTKDVVSKCTIFCSHDETYLINNENWNSQESKESFLSVEYFHPKMIKSVVLNIPRNYYMNNNVLFNPAFVLRCLEYQTQPYLFDMNYTLSIMDSNIDTITLGSTQYILIKENGYEIKSIEQEKTN
jgi:hypothetical protein